VRERPAPRLITVPGPHRFKVRPIVTCSVNVPAATPIVEQLRSLTAD
jgi:hypothetical protein